MIKPVKRNKLINGYAPLCPFKVDPEEFDRDVEAAYNSDSVEMLPEIKPKHPIFEAASSPLKY